MARPARGWWTAVPPEHIKADDSPKGRAMRRWRRREARLAAKAAR